MDGGRMSLMRANGRWLLATMMLVPLMFFVKIPVAQLLLFFAYGAYTWQCQPWKEKQPQLEEDPLEKLLIKMTDLEETLNFEELRRVVSELRQRQGRLVALIGEGSMDFEEQLAMLSDASEKKALQARIDAVRGAEESLEGLQSKERQIIHQLETLRIQLVDLEEDSASTDLDLKIRAFRELIRHKDS
jgi:hypothetical protein